MVAAKLIADAFGLDAKRAAFARTNAQPFSASPWIGCSTVLAISAVLIVLSLLLPMCLDASCALNYSCSFGVSNGDCSSSGDSLIGCQAARRAHEIRTFGLSKQRAGQPFF